MKHPRTFAAAALALAFLQAQAGTLTAQDLDGDGSVDAYFESTAGVSWYRIANVAGALRYSPAQAWAQSQVFAGLTDWRLPTLVELHDLYDTLGSVAGAMNTGPFANVTPGQYWSSSHDGVNIYGLDTRTGHTVVHVDNGASLYVWAVAGAAPIPEPSTLALLGVALAALWTPSRRRT